MSLTQADSQSDFILLPESVEAFPSVGALLHWDKFLQTSGLRLAWEWRAPAYILRRSWMDGNRDWEDCAGWVLSLELEIDLVVEVLALEGVMLIPFFFLLVSAQ